MSRIGRHDTSQPWTGPAIMHVDLDAFFAAVEQLDHPEWRGKPVIVGSPHERGVVSTASYEAREFGVGSAMPSVRAAALCPDAIWAPPRFERYHELSDAVFAMFREESPTVQPLSCDEAYLDVTPGRFAGEHPILIARRLRARVATLGITASVGIGANKSVAKIASDHDKPDGLTVVWPGEEAAFLAPLPVRALPGIGPRTASRLEEFGVCTLGALAALDERTAFQLLGNGGPSLVARAGGRDPREVSAREPAKSVSAERTFSHDIRSHAEIDEALASLAQRVARRLRRKGMSGRTITIKARYSDFSTKTVRKTLSHPVDDEAEIFEVARELVSGVWSPGVGLRLLGVGTSGFSEVAEQLDLLSSAEATPESQERRALVGGLDAVREKFGDTAVVSGRELLRRERRVSDTGDSEVGHEGISEE